MNLNDPGNRLCTRPNFTMAIHRNRITSTSLARAPGVRASGLTLIELILAVAVMTILTVIAVPSYQAYILKARNAQAIADLNKIKLAIDTYRLNNNNALPTALANTTAKTLTDPWGHAYVYTSFSGMHGAGGKRKDRNLVPINSEYDLYSKGADGLSVSALTAAQSQDDLIMANDGAFFGKASDY